MIEAWVILAILGGIGSNVYNFITRYVLKDGDDVMAFAWLFEVIRFLIFGAIILFEQLPPITLKTIALFVLVGAVELVSIYVWMKMHSYAQLSISSILIRLRLVLIPIFAFFFLREILHAGEYVGILILFVGIMIAGAPHKLTYDKGVRYAYVFSVVGALLAVVMKAASGVLSPAMIMFALSVPSTALLPLMVKNHKPKFAALLNKNFSHKVIMSLVNAGSFYLYTFALALGAVSVVQSIYHSMMIVSVFAGIILLKEREDIARKIFGTAITILGILVVTLTK